MKAFSESPPALTGRAGLILLLTEKLAPHRGTTTSTTKPISWLGAWTSLPPSRSWATSGCGSL